MAAGRPSKYTTELGAEICHCIATTPLGLDDICKQHDEFPHVATVRAWVWKNDEFHDMYFKAKRQQAALYAEETIKLADEVPTYTNKDGEQQIDNAGVQWRKLQVSTRQWHAARLMPKIYGDKQELEALSNDHEKLKEEMAELKAKLDKKNMHDY